MSRTAGPPVFQDSLGDLPPDVLDLLGGRLHEIGSQDGVLTDVSRNRRIRYRFRYPKDSAGPAAIVLLCHGGFGAEDGHTAFPHFGTAYARFGFFVVNVGHVPSANEVQHRYDCPLDVCFVIDTLARAAAAAQGTPWDAEKPLPLPPDFTGMPDVGHIGVLGHSYGALTAHALGGAELGLTMGIRSFRDPRVDAIVPIAPPGANRYGGFDKGPDNNSWKTVAIPAYVLLGEHDRLALRRQPFDRYPASGDKFLTIGKDQDHGTIAGSGESADVRRLLDLNTALFFHTYLRGGEGRCRIGTLAWLDGWTLERKLDPRVGPDCP